MSSHWTASRFRPTCPNAWDISMTGRIDWEYLRSQVCVGWFVVWLLSVSQKKWWLKSGWLCLNCDPSFKSGGNLRLLDHIDSGLFSVFSKFLPWALTASSGRRLPLFFVLQVILCTKDCFFPHKTGCTFFVIIKRQYGLLFFLLSACVVLSQDTTWSTWRPCRL